MNFSELALKIFEQSTHSYHITDDVDFTMPNPYPDGSIEHDLFTKNWIDTVQWHLEDIIRNPSIDAFEALALKRSIDRSNQDRTDLVERIDDYFLYEYKDVIPNPDAALNTESPAWAIDRLSILVLKIWHMEVETKRTDTNTEHLKKCNDKLSVLLEQKVDLMTSIDQLLDDISKGKRLMKVYRQMKMYNDPSLNPTLYSAR